MAKKNAVGKIRAQLVEMWKRTTTYDDKQNIYLNGENNLYPNEIELAVMNSPTAKRASVIMSKFISGSGVKNDLSVNSRKKYNLSDVVRMVSDDVSIQYGSFIHVGYGLNDKGEIVPNKLDTLDYSRCRISKEDSNDYAGKIIYKDFEKKKTSLFSKDKGEDEKWFYPFNSDPKIVLAQMKADSPNIENSGDEIEYLQELITNYKGQVYYLNLTPRFKYAVSPFDCVYNDCDTEYRMSLYGNTMIRSGFLGKLAVLTQGLDEDKAEKVNEDIQNWLGAENAQTVYRMDVEQAENLDNILKIIQVPTQYDDDMFLNTEKRIMRNIMGAANNIPKEFIYGEGTSLFGSGEMYIEAKRNYEEQTQEERKILEKTFTMLGFPCEIIKLTDEGKTIAPENTDEPTTPEVDEKTAEAQAALRGSVGGVQGILGIQQSVSNETTDFESAITILMEIYGFTRAVSSALLGKPEIKEENDTDNAAGL